MIGERQACRAHKYCTAAPCLLVVAADLGRGLFAGRSPLAAAGRAAGPGPDAHELEPSDAHPEHDEEAHKDAHDAGEHVVLVVVVDQVRDAKLDCNEGCGGWGSGRGVGGRGARGKDRGLDAMFGVVAAMQRGQWGACLKGPGMLGAGCACMGNAAALLHAASARDAGVHDVWPYN